MEPAAVSALAAELGRKSGICWLRYAEPDALITDHPVWHLWHDDALIVVSSGAEQPLPGIGAVATLEVVMKSKDTGAQLLTWIGTVCQIRPEDTRWPAYSAALATNRISIASLTETPKLWVTDSVIVRIVPTGAVAPPQR